MVGFHDIPVYYHSRSGFFGYNIVLVERMKPHKKLLHLPVLPILLFSIYPVLALWNINFDKIALEDIPNPLIRCLVGSILLYLVLRLVLRIN